MARLNRLSYVDRATGESIRRYVHPHPGSLVHVVGIIRLMQQSDLGGAFHLRVGENPGQSHAAEP